MDIPAPSSAHQWQVRGTYYEVCNCDAPCPCRRHGGRRGRRSQYDTCDFALSWEIREGHFGSHDLSGLRVALAGRWDNRESPKPSAGTTGPPWRVILYVDDRAQPDQHSALSNIFLGWAGGTPLANYAKAIGEVYAIKSARIDLDHTPGRERLLVGESIWAATARTFQMEEQVTCGIPGHEQPGQELVATLMRVEDKPFHWAVTGRCGFSTDFDFRSKQ
jgi:hypothetical protein